MTKLWGDLPVSPSLDFHRPRLLTWLVGSLRLPVPLAEEGGGILYLLRAEPDRRRLPFGPDRQAEKTEHRQGDHEERHFTTDQHPSEL